MTATQQATTLAPYVLKVMKKKKMGIFGWFATVKTLIQIISIILQLFNAMKSGPLAASSADPMHGEYDQDVLDVIQEMKGAGL